MKLSKRLETVASFVRRGSNLADIGTDHGYIPINLVLGGIVPHAVAMDVRKGPLERAKEHIRDYKLENQIETRLSDGLEKLMPGEADTVVIAGMGGELILHILSEGEHVRGSISQWVLSPQSDLDKVRRYLAEHHFRIEKETMVEDEGKYYTIMSVVPGDMDYARCIDYKYGKCLLEEKHPVLKSYLARERRLAEDVLGHLEGNESVSSAERKQELLKELEWIKEAEDAVR